MKNFFITLCIFIPFSLLAQKEKKEQPFFRKHIIHFFAPGFIVGFDTGIMAGVAYSYRFTPVVALTTTLQGGVDGYGGISRIFIESQFNIWGERRVQFVFSGGMHLGSTVTRYEQYSKLHYDNAMVGGLNTGIGMEILFGKKRWMTGLYTRGIFTFGTTSIISLNLHVQPTIAYRI